MQMGSGLFRRDRQRIGWNFGGTGYKIGAYSTLMGKGGAAYVLQQYLLSSVPNQVRNSPSSLLNGACNRTRLQHRVDKSQRATLTFAQLEFRPDICEHPPLSPIRTVTKGWGPVSVSGWLSGDVLASSRVISSRQNRMEISK